MSMEISTARALVQERRPSPRSKHCYRIRLEVEDFFEPFSIVGFSRNLSTTGVRVRVDRPISSGTHCQVKFVDAAGRVRPAAVRATVRNVTREIVGGKKVFDVGLEFEAPLEFMKRPGEI